jgi:hypothetical protein
MVYTKQYFLKRFFLYNMALFYIWPTLCQAGVGHTKHDLCPHEQERNCTLCHIPHTNQSPRAVSPPDDKPADGNKTAFFTLPKAEEVLCLSCHDGVLASDICVIVSHELEGLELSGASDANRYYGGGMLFFDTCEKHYNLLSFYKDQLPDKRLSCSTCHDVHNLKGSLKTGLISGQVYFRHKVCLLCHQR